MGNLFSAAVSTDGVALHPHPRARPRTSTCQPPSSRASPWIRTAGSNAGTASFANIAIGAPVTTTLTPQAPANPCPSPVDLYRHRQPQSPRGTPPRLRPPVSPWTAPAPASPRGRGAPTRSTTSTSPSRAMRALAAQVVDPGRLAGRRPGGDHDAGQRVAHRALLRGDPQSGGVGHHLVAVLRRDSWTAPAPGDAHGDVAGLRGDRGLRRHQSRPAQQFFTTETSPDDVNWTPVLGSTQAIPMGTTYLAGLAATGGPTGPPRRWSTTTSPWPPITNPPASICPDDFTCSDEGHQHPGQATSST